MARKSGEPPAASRLRDFGLDGYEAAAYLALLDGVPRGAGHVSRISGVPHGRVYDVLNSLAAKGLVEVRPTAPKEYAALPAALGLRNRVEQLRSDSDARLRDLESRVDDVASGFPRQVLAQDGFSVRIVAGEANLASRVAEMLGSARRSIYLAGELPLRTLKCRRAVEQAAARGVKVKAMGVIDETGRVVIARIGAETREKPFFFHYFLTVDEVELLIVTFDEDGLPYGILTRNPDLVRAHVHQFLRFWERG